MKEAITSYYNALKAIKAQNANEHSYRTPLENLLNALRPSDIRIIHEPKTESGQGSIRPDFKVFKQIDSKTELSYNTLMGFIECKKLDSNLDEIINPKAKNKTKQIDKYLDICPNIILTNYNRFILLAYKKVIYDITLFPHGLESNLLNQQKELISQDAINQFSFLLNSFFEASNRSIKSKLELVKVLSTQSFYLGVKLREEYRAEEKTSFHEFFNDTKDSFESVIDRMSVV